MNHSLKKSYDFLIIGAGPGGLIAALNLLKSSSPYSIALLDRRDPWEEPVACAEAVHKQGLISLVPKVEKGWIREEVDGVIFVAPDGTEVKFVQKASGVLIDRALMHKNLAEECERGGVHCHFRSRVRSVSEYNGEFRTVKYDGEHAGEIKARVVIDCSGPGVGFGQQEKIVQGNLDLEPALFALVKGIKFPTNYIQMFFGKCYAPGGYAWLFPRDKEVANVGIVIGKKYTRSCPPRRALLDFIKTTYPEAEILTIKGGGIACGHSKEDFAVQNMFKVGDAANMVSPISRAGILEAMLGGKLAAEAALKIIELKEEQDKIPFYQEYKKKWEEKYGLENQKMAKGKEGFNRISDNTFNRAAHRLQKIPQEKLTMGRIAWATLLSNPFILWHLRGLLKG